jgi:integrase
VRAVWTKTALTERSSPRPGSGKRTRGAAGIETGLEEARAPGPPEQVGCHDLRHSCAAFAFSIGMTPVEVGRLQRHSDPAITLTTYAGLDDASVQKLGEKLAAGLGHK